MDTFKEIPLTQGQIALVDCEDYEEISQFKWYAQRDYNGKFYAVRSIHLTDETSVPKELMHRRIMNAPDGVEVDHKQHTLDNRKSNLRLSTHQQNLCNRTLQRNNTSGYKGVTKRAGKYVAQIGMHGRIIYLGRFNDPEEAARAYDRAAQELHENFCQGNFTNTHTPHSHV